MPYSDFPNGVTSFGVPVLPSNGGIGSAFSTWWFVDGNLGSNGYPGTSPMEPFLTMARAFQFVGSGDVICFRGNIAEQIQTPAGVFDVTILGGANQPRHADAHTGNNGYSAATWKTPSSPTAATPLLTIRQQGWRLVNFLMDGPSDAPALRLFRDGGAGDAEDDASHAWIQFMKFVAAQNHIDFNGGLSQCVVDGCLFFGATADSINETVGAGIGTNNYHRFSNNVWMNNATHIDIGLNYGSIYGNTFGPFSSVSIDLRTGNNNAIWLNQFAGTYSNVGGYYAGTGDEWGGNFNSLSGGVTAADPA